MSQGINSLAGEWVSARCEIEQISPTCGENPSLKGNREWGIRGTLWG
jgi:hypothetical protein